ncbi:hypothetical protein C7S13_8618 [Burkholderia cepacia]|nr:hypothetical protein [Burkholderia cepacia]
MAIKSKPTGFKGIRGGMMNLSRHCRFAANCTPPNRIMSCLKMPARE